MSIFRTAVAALTLVAGSASALPAAAQMVTAANPQSIVDVLKADGYPATLSRAKSGDPKIESEADGTNFTIWFLNCTANKDCATIQFTAGYDLKKAPAWEKMNEWNRTRRFGRAYLDDESDPILEMDIDLDSGGMSRALFSANLETWSALVGSFEEHIGFR